VTKFSERITILRGGYNYGSTSTQPPCDSQTTATRPRYDHSTTHTTCVYGLLH